MKANLKLQALSLRKKGKSYRDILREVPVAKSTLSYWVRSVELTKEQILILKRKRIASALKGSIRRRDIRIKNTKEIFNNARKEMLDTKNRELLIIGTCLYWAEGAKQRNGNNSQRVVFANSDPKMVKLYLLWLDRICNIAVSSLDFELYIHESGNIESAVMFWKKELNIQKLKIRFKKNKLPIHRKNVNEDYKGLVRIIVRKSTNLNRKINGWIKGILDIWGVV